MIDHSIDISYDEEADAAYLYVEPRGPGRSVGRTHICDVELPAGAIIAGFAPDGRLAGFEILGASRVLPPWLLRNEADGVSSK